MEICLCRILGNDVENKQRKRKRNNLEEEDDNEEDYERLPRKQAMKVKEKKMILPIKTKHGIVPQTVEYGNLTIPSTIITVLTIM